MKISALGSFRLISYLEGSSFLILLCIAMPLKYLADRPELVAVTGIIHGFLFVIYLISIIGMAIIFRWKALWIFAAFLAAFLPFGPFIFDRRLKRITAV